MSIFKKLSIVLHSVHWYMYMFILTRNSAIVDKPRDAYVQKQCRGWPPKTRPPHIGYHAKFGRSTPNGTSVIKEIRLKIWFLASRLSRSFKVIGTHKDRSAICDFLLMSHRNHGPISYRFQDKRRFKSKIAKFSHPVKGFSWNWVPALGVKILEWWGYRAEKEVWRYLQPSGYNIPTWQTDGRSDRGTMGDSKDRTHA